MFVLCSLFEISFIHRLKGTSLGKVATDTGSFLKDIQLFDHLEFGVTNKEARMMPLSTRKLIETAFLSFLDAGIDYRGKNIGCYMAGIGYDMFTISGHVCFVSVLSGFTWADEAGGTGR